MFYHFKFYTFGFCVMEYCLGFDRSTAIFTSGKYFNVEEQPLLQLKITLLGIMGINEYKPPNSFKGDH